MHDLDAPRFEELHDRNEVSVRGYEDRDVVVVNPCQADHCCRNVGVDAFFFGAAHVSLEVPEVDEHPNADTVLSRGLVHEQSLPKWAVEKCRDAMQASLGLY